VCWELKRPTPPPPLPPLGEKRKGAPGPALAAGCRLDFVKIAATAVVGWFWSTVRYGAGSL
jgi:hypothetical protein